MRLPGDGKALLALTLIGVSASCVAPIAPVVRATAPVASRSGPAGDYPMVLGDPFTIDGITYTPSDRLNYDEVGYATLLATPAAGIIASHKTLPLPSYVEVTSLESGRTVLVRVEQRGPMTNARLLGLSNGALAQLGILEGSAIRVRRVNPPEAERSLLRQAAAAPLRLETPAGLLEVLKRNLPAADSASLAREETMQRSETQDEPGVISRTNPSVEASRLEIPAKGQPAARSARSSSDNSGNAQPMTADGWVVQAGAFSNRSSADRVAADIAGFVEPAGVLWRVRTGPFASMEEARAALAKVRGAGYKTAQIYRIR